MEGGQGGGAGRVLAAAEGKQVQLALHVPLAAGGDAVQHLAIDLDQLGAAVAHAVKGPGLDEALHHPAVEVIVKHPVAEVHKIGKGTARLPLFQQTLDHAPAHALQGHQAKSNALPHHSEVGIGLVHVRGQQGNAHVPALGDILGHLFRGVQHGGEQGGHILLGVVEFEPGRLIGHHGIAHGVGLVKGIVCKVGDLVIDALGHCLGNAVGGAAGDVSLRVPVEEGGPLPLDVLQLLFGHGPADHVGLAQGIASQLLEDLDDLLLIDDAAIGVGEDRPQGGVLIGDLLRVLLAGDEPGDGVHGAGAVQGDDGGDIFDGLGFQPHAHAGHAGGLHLEHAGGAALGQHVHHLGVVLRDVFQGEAGLLRLDHLHCVVQNGQVPQAQKVHL